MERAISIRSPTLHDFLVANRGQILDRSRAKLAGRHAPTPTASELADGLPHFLNQLITILGGTVLGGTILGGKKNELTAEHDDMAASATLHGEALLRRGLTVAQVVQDYGSICQSVTEVAAESKIAITADEFQTFNQCLDEAIARAVTEYEHQRDRAIAGPSTAHLGFLAHEMRNLLTTSMLTFEAISKGGVGVHGSTGALHERSLRRMRVLIDRTLAEVRLEADIQTSERVVVAQLLEEIEIVATVEAKDHDVHFSIDAGRPDVAVDGDRQILASVLANLVQNAFKFTRRDGHVTVSTRSTGDRVLIEVQDECGGLVPGKAEELFHPFEQQGADRTGLGLGLSISLKGVRAHRGDIHVRDLPGSGCIFTVELPRASPAGGDHSRHAAIAPPTSPRAQVAQTTTTALPPSVLIVDDDEDILSALQDLLSSRYRLTLARDGGQALAALGLTSFDLVIADLNLPVVDGLRIIETVRRGDENNAPAFLFLSGQSDPRIKARALALGAADFMTKPFDAEELVARMARILATATRETSLRADAMTDSLTGLANYRSFAETLDRELERSRRYALPLSLILLDLDHMKAINDQFGHDAGDDAIRLVAKVLTEGVRKFELVARQGGDEFAVILPNTGESNARQLADRLRQAVAAQSVSGLKLTASLGLASWEHSHAAKNPIEAAALVKAGDEALYRAKRAGRDRVESQRM